MLDILDQKLPREISDLIFKKLKDDFNKQLKFILENCIVWIKADNKISFLILEKNLCQNPFYPLIENENRFIIKSKKYNKKKI